MPTRLICLALILSLVDPMYAMESENNSVNTNDYSRIDFDFDTDFCCARQISNAFMSAADMGLRLLGYDSYAFEKAKYLVKNSKYRLEMVLALAIVDKFPTRDSLETGFDWLLEEIKEGNLSNNYDAFKKIEGLKYSNIFSSLAELMETLSKTERQSLKEFLCVNLKSIEPSIYQYLSSEECSTVSDCLFTILKNCI